MPLRPGKRVGKAAGVVDYVGVAAGFAAVLVFATYVVGAIVLRPSIDDAGTAYRPLHDEISALGDSGTWAGRDLMWTQLAVALLLAVLTVAIWRRLPVGRFVIALWAVTIVLAAVLGVTHCRNGTACSPELGLSLGRSRDLHTAGRVRPARAHRHVAVAHEHRPPAQRAGRAAAVDEPARRAAAPAAGGGDGGHHPPGVAVQRPVRDRHLGRRLRLGGDQRVDHPGAPARSDDGGVRRRAVPGEPALLADERPVRRLPVRHDLPARHVRQRAGQRPRRRPAPRRAGATTSRAGATAVHPDDGLHQARARAHRRALPLELGHRRRLRVRHASARRAARRPGLQRPEPLGCGLARARSGRARRVVGVLRHRRRPGSASSARSRPRSRACRGSSPSPRRC